MFVLAVTTLSIPGTGVVLYGADTGLTGFSGLNRTHFCLGFDIPPYYAQATDAAKE